MAMITVCGYPCSGKTTRAHQLASFLQHRLNDPATPARHRSASKVVLINDESLGIAKAAYDDTRAEKPARAALFSAVQRNLARDTIVVVDAMNYIKGSRYQMYCAAREIGVRTCTLFVATPPDKCREWNTERADSSRYAEATLDNLISRFEEPNSAARWDAPLITIAFDDPALDSRPESSADGQGAMEGSEAAQRIWSAITEGEIKPPNVATQVVHTSSTSYLTLLDSASSALITSLLSLQSLSPLSGPTTLLVPLSSSPPTKIDLTLPSRPLTLPMLQRLKRQFVQLHARTASSVEFGEEEVVRMFGRYLGEQLR
ncbi:kti12, chromatin associated [Rhodotorula toruloides]